MNYREKRLMIHQKLEIMKKCYQECDVNNFDLFYDTFFDRNRLPIIIGTDNGAWFHTMGQIRWLIHYDWQKWGRVEIDTWNFTIYESESHDLVRTRGVLDFQQDRVWDLDIIMIFSKEEFRRDEFGGPGGVNRTGKDYRCRLMQFKVPRNEIRPVVILNKSKEEQTKSEKEMLDLKRLNGDVRSDLMREHLAGRVISMLREQRPYLDNLDVREEMIYMEENDEGFLFALTGFCVHTELNALLPFRIVGIGQGYEILDSEFSHPFVSTLG